MCVDSFVCLRICLSVHTCMYVYKDNARIHICRYVCDDDVCVRVCVYMCMCVCMYECVCKYLMKVKCMYRALSARSARTTAWTRLN